MNKELRNWFESCCLRKHLIFNECVSSPDEPCYVIIGSRVRVNNVECIVVHANINDDNPYVHIMPLRINEDIGAGTNRGIHIFFGDRFENEFKPDVMRDTTTTANFKKGETVIDLENTNMGVGVIIFQLSSKEYVVHCDKGGFLAKEDNLVRVQQGSGGSGVPIGPVPEHRWIDNRIMELSKAIYDHIDRGQKVPRIWIDELVKHMETFNNR